MQDVEKNKAYESTRASAVCCHHLHSDRVSESIAYQVGNLPTVEPI